MPDWENHHPNPGRRKNPKRSEGKDSGWSCAVVAVGMIGVGVLVLGALATGATLLV